jgi:hypothetical protein
MNSSGAPDAANPDGTEKPAAVENIELDVAGEEKPEVKAPEVPKAKVALLAQPLATSSPTSQELRQVQIDNRFVQYVILPDAAGSWQLSRIKTNNDINNPQWFLEPADMNADAAISAEVREIRTILDSASKEAMLDSSSEENTRINGLIKAYNKEESRRKIISEFFDTESKFETNMREFSSVVGNMPRSAETAIFMAPYRELIPVNFLAAAQDFKPKANSMDEWVLLKAEALINTFVQTNSQGQIEMTPEFKERLRIMTDSIIMFENFSAVFGEANAHLRTFAIMPTQRVTRYDLLAHEILTQLKKITPQSPEMQARLDSTLEKYASIKAFTLQANAVKREVESLGSILSTQGVLGSMAREGMSLQAVGNGNGPAQKKVAQDFLAKLDAIASAMIKTKHYFSEEMKNDSIKDFIGTVNGHVDARIKENKLFTEEGDVKRLQAANVLYAPVMNTLTEAFLLHANPNDLADSMLNYIKIIDKKLNTEGVPGIIFSKAGTGKLSYEKVFATLEKATPEVVSEVVTKMFDNLQAQLSTSNKANPAQATAYQNAFIAINAMGPQAIAQWNKNAAEKYYDLSMPNPVAYAKLVGAAKTEAERTQIVLDAVKTASSNYPELAKLMNNLPQANNSKELRQNILFAVLQSYQDSYLDGRFKQNFATAKTTELTRAEGTIEAIEKALADKGQRGLFGENLDAKGAFEKEQVIMPAIAELREDQAKKLIENLYNRAKAVAVKANPSTEDEYVFRNAFKELKRLDSPAALQYWMENANKETDKNITSRMQMTDAEMKGKIQEEVVATRFKGFTGQAIEIPVVEKDEFEMDTPIALEDIDDEEELMPETPTSPLSSTSTVADAAIESSNSPASVEQRAASAPVELFAIANLDILGKIAEELKARRAVAAGYGFNQMQIWDAFSQNVQAISQGIVASGEPIKPQKFYAVFMKTFMDGYLIHERGSKDIFSEGIRAFMENVDKYFHSYGLKGVVYANAASMPGTTEKDKNALQTLDANPKFRDVVVAELFNSLKNLIEARAHGPHEELQYTRTLNAITSMGAASVAQWNKLADEGMHELTIKKDRVNYTDLVKLKGPEEVRRKTFIAEIKVFVASPETIIPNKPELVAQLSAIEKATNTGTRTQMLQDLQVALLSTFTAAYLQGRSKKMGFSHQSPELKAVDALIMQIEKSIAANKQKNIFVESPGDIKEFNMRGTYALADSVFGKTKELSQPKLEAYIQKLYTDVKGLMANQDGESQKIFVNLVKLLVRSGPAALEQWNAVALKDNPKLALPDTRIEWKEEKAKTLFLGQVKTDPSEKDVKELAKMVASEIKKVSTKSKSEASEQKAPDSPRASVSVSSHNMFAKGSKQPAPTIQTPEPRTPTPTSKK